MKDLIYKKKDVLGLDIGTNNIKYVQLKKEKKLTKLIGYGHLKVPEGIVIEGVIAEPERLAKIMKKELFDPPWGKITATRAVSALPDSRLFTHVLELPLLTEKEIHEAVRLEVDQSIPISASDLYTDWQIVNETKEKLFVFMAAAPKAIVDSYVSLLKILEMEPLALEISLVAAARSIISNKNQIGPILIIDIGGQTTNIAVYEKGIQIASSHPIGSETIKELLVTSLGISNENAELAIRAGILGNGREVKIIKESLRRVLTETERMIRYYKEKRDGKNIEEIILCGGMGALNKLDSYIEENTKVKTHVGNPWSNISVYPLKPVPKKDIPMFATAIGLSLRGIKDE